MLRDCEVQNATAFVGQNEEDVQNLKPDRRNREEVRRNHIFHVVLQKRSPALRRRSFVSHQILTYSRLANVDAEFQQLAVDLGRTPERVLATHSPNELAYFLRHGWPSTLTMATLPCPEQTKSLPLPANDRICLDNHQSPSPFRPPAGQPSPKPTICGAQSRSFHGTLQHVQLMPKCQDFNLKGGAATKRASQEGKQRRQNGHRRG